MDFAICTVPAAPVRKEDSHRSEMVNQLLFGDTLEILEEKGEWFRIRSTYDQYEGWLTYHLVERVHGHNTAKPQAYVATGLVNPVTLPDQLVNIPMGSSLTGFDEETRLLWKEEMRYHGSFRNASVKPDAEFLKRTAHVWIAAPYLWGGKTFMGVDCSGYVQTVFKVAGIALQRDASQQAEQGTMVSLPEAKAGDLAFFHNEAGKVIHVGMVWNGHEIIHASGRVRIDLLDAEGILNRENNLRTHQLHSVRRYF